MQVLMPKISLPRVANRLPHGLELLLMTPEGELELNGKAITQAQAAPRVAWGNTDVYVDGPAQQFMVLCLKSQASLQWFQSSAAGFDHPVFGMLVDQGVTLTNSDASAPAIAEFVFARLLDHYHQNRERRRLQAEQRWERARFREICDGRWLVVGLGPVGRAVASRARAFGAHVTGVRRSPRGDAPVDRELAASELHSALPEAEVVLLAAPSNQDSRGMVDAAFLAAMAEGSVLINVGRGDLVQEHSLLQALDRGQPELAILDVFTQEPLSSQSRFWDHPRVLLSAHCATASDGFERRGDQVFLDNLARYVKGEPLERVVPPQRVKASQAPG